MTGIERLRRFASDMRESGWKSMHDDLSDIADLIEREYGRSAETVRSDAMEAWRWVRDHGGLAQVKADYAMGEGFSDLADEVARRLGLCIEGLDAQDSRPLLMDALDRRLMPEGCDWEFLKLHMSNLRGFMLDVMDRLGVDKSDSDAPEIAFDVLDRRIMPEGMEWPRYEDGEPVRIGDKLMTSDGAVRVEELSLTICDTDGGVTCVPFGERVKRPTVLAADGEPLEVGQTVYHTDTGREYQIHSISDDGKGAFVYNNSLGQDAAGLHLCPVGNLTHQRPVLDADGVPIKKGDTVYLLPGEWCDEFPCLGFHGGEELEVFTDEEPHHVSGGVQCREKGKKIDFRGYCYPQPSQLTHERPDTWQRIEEDAGCTATKYNERRGTIFTTKQQVARDLVRRCRALSERGR